MKKFIFLFILIILLFNPFLNVYAQSNNEPDPYENSFIKADHPQWVKDVRRFDIIAFGAFPFAFFFTTLAHDIYRWGKEADFEFSDQGRRYAPWPIKSVDAVDFTTEEFRKNVLMSIGVAASIAAADLLVHKLKYIVQKRRIESLPPTGSYTIERTRTVNETIQPEKNFLELLHNKLKISNENETADTGEDSEI